MTEQQRGYRGLLPKVIALTPTSIETWSRCERRYLLRHVLGLPASDPGLSNDEGLRLHALLRFVHEHGTCQDDAYVHETLIANDCDTDSMRTMLRRHQARCPTASIPQAATKSDGRNNIRSNATSRGHHEVERARYHHAPVPMFVASARLDAVWNHDGIFDVRDYKSGARSPNDLRDDPRAWIQAWVLAPRATARGERLRLRYEYLAPEVLEDPDPWDPDADDLEVVEESLRTTVLAIHDSEFPGVADREICSRCPYRSICSDSAAPGVPTWPVSSIDAEEFDHDS